MKRFWCSLLCACMVIAGSVVAQAVQPAEFAGAYNDFRAGDISPEDFIVTCEYVIARHSANNPAYRMRAYSGLWEASVMTGDPAKAEEAAQRAINEWPGSPLGYQLMSDTFAMEVNRERAAHFLRMAIERTQGPRDKAALQRRLKNISYYINSFMPLWADFDESPDEAQRMYQGSKVTLSGIVISTMLDVDAEGRSVVVFCVEEGSPKGVYCTFDKESRGVVEEIQEGTALTMEGVCLGLVHGNVIVQHTTIVP